MPILNRPDSSLQHCDVIDNPARPSGQSGGCSGSATAAVDGAQGLQFAVCFGDNAVDLGRDQGGLGAQLDQEIGPDQRHVAGENQVPLPCVSGTERRFDSREWSAIGCGIGDCFVAKKPVGLRVTNQQNRMSHTNQKLRYMLGQSTAAIGQKGLAFAHSQAFSPYQNEARRTEFPYHLEMVTLQYVNRFWRSAPVLLLCLGVTAGHAESVATRTTLVVRADAHSGRLIRSVVVAPRPASLPVSSASVTPATSEALQEIEAGTISELIDAIAERNQVEAPLVHSVIKAESNYNPAALSPKGAQGLMQLIPSTARRFGVSNSFNIQQNIEGGVKYLKFLMDLYHNDYVKVIAAYNAGEGAVTKYGGIPPYSETINYVYRVGKNLKAARQFAESKAAERKVKPVTVETAAVKPADEPHSIQAVTGDDGRIYYKTQ